MHLICYYRQSLNLTKLCVNLIIIKPLFNILTFERPIMNGNYGDKLI